MSDNQTFELRMKLTEHGIKYEARDSGRLCATSWVAHGAQWNYRVFEGQSSLTMGNPWLGCTPEQAIAATLGNERATHGTLTAELVEKIVDRNCEWYEGGEIDAQAILDELNAVLGSGTCEPKWTLQGKTQTQEFWRCECGNCGEFFGVEDRSSFPFKMTIDEVDIPNFCPNCGARIRKAVER